MYTLGFHSSLDRTAGVADGKPILSTSRHRGACNGIEQAYPVTWVIGVPLVDTENRWTVHIKATARSQRLTCEFLFLCSGYYNYDENFFHEFASSKGGISSGRSSIGTARDLDFRR